ncbi:MAG: heat-inducible transcriptional repressor HrcA [Anaerolineae bacterium]
MNESANGSTAKDAPELTPRQRMLLGLVVREYTESAVPVGSKSLVAQYALSMSSATIRNEFAYLEDLGLVRQPHTSAGRVPTEMGYRYFVGNLMLERELSLDDRRRIRHQFHQLGMELSQWLQLSAAVLADTVRNAALVTVPKAAQVRFKHMELVSTYGSAVLLVLVLHDGTVRQQGLLVRQTMAQEDLSNISDRLCAMFAGLSAAEIEAQLPLLTPFEREVAAMVAAAMRDTHRAAAVQAYHEGVRHLLVQPEFSSGAGADRALRLVEGDWLIAKVLPQVFSADGVTVIIGSEDRLPEASDLGLVLTRYGVGHELVGALGVLGPARMQYERVIPAVRYMAGLLSGLVWELFGPGERTASAPPPVDEAGPDEEVADER